MIIFELHQNCRLIYCVNLDSFTYYIYILSFILKMELIEN